MNKQKSDQSIDELLGSRLELLENAQLVPTQMDARTAKIFEMTGHPEVLVRQRQTDNHKEAAALLEKYQEAKNHFADLHNRYGVRSVEQDSSLHIDPTGHEALRTIVDKIDGENLFDAKELPAEAADELNDLYTNLARYYRDAMMRNETFWGDCKNSQFVYGTKYGEKSKHMYVVDIDPMFFKPGESESYTIEWCLNSLAADLVESEQKLPAHIKLSAGRAELEQIIVDILKNNSQSKPLIMAQQTLNPPRH